MKLIPKTNLNFLLLASLLFIAGSILFYTLLRKTIISHIDDDLLTQKKELLSKNDFDDSKPFHALSSDNITVIQKIDSLLRISNTFTDTVLLNAGTGEYLPYRQLKFSVKSKHGNYIVKLYKPHQGTDKLTINLVLIIMHILVLFMIVLLFINRYTLKQSWSDFYQTLERLMKFNLNSNKKFEPINSDIDEFNDLNNVLVNITAKIIEDYENLKEYTENTSHEIQTPLAVINSKIEQLLQQPDIDEAKLMIINDIYNASLRLSKINKSLIYLTNIDKISFDKNQNLLINEIIDENLLLFDEIINLKQIKIEKNYENQIFLNLNTELANVLISNLIKNSVKHNIQSGLIRISLNKNYVEISNTGDTKTVNPEEFFKRFRKAKSGSDSLGIGLSIVKKICDTLDMTITYEIENNMHKIKILFA